MTNDERDVRFAAQSIYQNMYRPYPPIDFCKLIFTLLFKQFNIERSKHNSPITVTFNQFHHRRFFSRIYGRWSSNVSGSTIFLSFCNIWLIFYFIAMAYLYIGKSNWSKFVRFFFWKNVCFRSPATIFIMHSKRRSYITRYMLPFSIS